MNGSLEVLQRELKEEMATFEKRAVELANQFVVSNKELKDYFKESVLY